MLTRNFHIYIAMLVIILTVGCGGNNPVVWPDSEKPSNLWAGDSHRISGLYTFYCDPVSGVIDIEPIRDVDLHLNALKFLEPPPYLHLTLESQPVFNGNIVDVDIGLRNPYIGLDQFTGFDVCGIVFTKGTETGFNDPDVVIAGVGDTRLLNPDGYTRWWNPSEFPHGDNIFSYIDGKIGTPDEDADYNCTINGYKYFADDLEKNTPLSELDPSNRGMFSAGQQNIRHYTIDLSGGLIFNYAVDACWNKPEGQAPYDVPDDFPPGANRQEAYNIEVTELKNDLYYVDDTYFIGGNLVIQVDVWDHFNAGNNAIFTYSPDGLPFLDALIPSHRNKNVWAAFRLRHLMLNQQPYQFGSQRKCTPFGVLDVPFPSVLPILLRSNIDSHSGKVDIAPGSIQKFTPSHASTQAHTNKQFPFYWRTFLLILLSHHA